MLVPVVVAASTSPSPANLAPVIDTVAELSVFTPSGSLTVMLGDNVVAALSSVHAALAATLLKVGGISACGTDTVSVCTVLKLFDEPPSLSTQVTVRVGLRPPFVGSRIFGSKVTEFSTV